MAFHSLYYLITKALGDEFKCNDHASSFIRINRSMDLICEHCYEEESFPLEDLFQNPIGAIMWLNNSPKCSSEWMRKSIEQQIIEKFVRSKEALQSYMRQLIQKLRNFCQTAVNQYNTIVDNLVQNSSKSLYNLQRLNEIYSSQLQQQIHGNDLSLTFITTTIKKFLTSNQDPSRQFSSQTQQVINCIQKFPFLQIQKLTTHYEQICDPLKWKLSNFIKNSTQNQIFDGVDSLHLADKKHYLRYGSQGVAIYSYENKTPITICSDIEMDECHQINGYKVFGYNKDQILVLSYIDPAKISVIGRTNTKFPSEVMYQNPYIYYKSDNRQWRWDILSQPELLSKQAHSQLIQSSKDLTQRQCQSRQPVQFTFEDNFITLS